MKLNIKLPLLLLPLTALSLMLVGYVCYVKLRENAEEKTFKQASAVASQIISHVTSITATARANVSLFADYPTVKYFLLTEDETERYELMQRPLQKTLRNFQKAYPEYYEIRLLLPDGFEDIRLVNRDIDNQTEEEGTTALFREIQSASDVFQRFAFNPDNDELACFIFKRISLANEYRADFSFLPTLRGYLGITLDTTVLGTLLEENSLGATGGMLLTDNDGRPLLVPSHLKWMVISNQLAGLLTGNASQKQFHSLQLAGHDYYHASHQLTDEMQLHILVPEKELHDASRNIGRLVMGTTVLVLLLSLSLMLYLLKFQVIVPLRQLQRAILRIEEGEELVQIPITRKDELGELGSGFNRMSHALKKSNDQIREMAFNDSLTLLPNRFMFYKTLKRALEISLVEDKRIGVFFIDLDNFKQINDTLGHSFGDKLLKEAGRRLQESLRGNDLTCHANFKELEHNLSRLGGDEFTVLLSGITSAAGIGKIAERLLCAIKAPFVFDGQEHYITASIGIAVYPEDGTNAEDLVKHSDLAMYQAKKNGKGRYEFYSQEISRQAHNRSRLEQRLRVASAENAFEVFYQPIINAQTQKLTSLEALIRWRDSELGNVPPDQFIPIAEDIGLIHQIGEWVLHDVCRQLNEWTSMGLTGLKVAVNVSGKQLENADFVKLVLKKLKEFDLSPDALYLELTESAIIDGKAVILETLAKFQKNGIRIALDDFGTGYSSLSYLRKLPINVLKIDRSFIQGLGEQNNNILLSSIITMAQALGLEVVAEGVEEQGQFAFLKKEGCNSLQGYLFSRPEPNQKITEKIQSGELIISEG